MEKKFPTRIFVIFTKVPQLFTLSRVTWSYKELQAVSFLFFLVFEASKTIFYRFFGAWVLPWQKRFFFIIGKVLFFNFTFKLCVFCSLNWKIMKQLIFAKNEKSLILFEKKFYLFTFLLPRKSKNVSLERRFSSVENSTP